MDIRRVLNPLLKKIGFKGFGGFSPAWLAENSFELWLTRQALADELSRRMFDDALILKIVGYRRFYFPREEFSPIFEIVDDRPFSAEGLLSTYIGTPLRDFHVNTTGVPVRVIAADGMIDLLNAYRQYFICRDGLDFSPAPGEIILDCGACIGDVGVLFAGMVGPHGQVHMFDPMPAHVRVCRHQAKYNPNLEKVIHIVPMAVGSRSDFEGKSLPEDNHINPAARATSEMPFISIDDYVDSREIQIDYIKMDIEGGEIPALEGAAKTIASQKPRLAISAYHKEDDLWTIRKKILSLNPDYQLHFGHHTPVQWESVIYAIPKTRHQATRTMPQRDS
ncbi:FkbM family methyltransferase [Dyella lutea]|uniref:FkbM family methyltransferase n=1 Tax=Dyella lutea TaxID=2950441 RepID=A0ABT1F9M4_9GAMM|nr:FkbM family methyltransferase [Dyella lutea]MCP1374078.1 FkbM family methyltransferase [Dyella lutea]